jgi:hypothetical protein
VVTKCFVPPLQKYDFLKLIHKKKKQKGKLTATGHSRGADSTAGVPCKYMMHLQGIK